jgi:anti-sigma-K factor RskA
VTSDEARELFSVAYDAQLPAAEQSAFESALQADGELAGQYAAFCATLDAVGGAPTGAPPTPDLLAGVQRRLRNASGGRYYGDRFAERSGVGWFQPWMLLLGLAIVIGLALLAVRLLSEVALPS